MRVLKFVVFEVKECGKLNVFTIFNNLCACQLIRLRDFVMFKCSFGEQIPKNCAENSFIPEKYSHFIEILCSLKGCSCYCSVQFPNIHNTCVTFE